MRINEPNLPSQQPTADEIAGMQWWNSLTDNERAKALKDAGWKAGGSWTPSAADAWVTHKKRSASRDA
ncbi:MAG: hypothetical protein M3N19_05000 [Candidatus Eremiobacteraeota bacterium]|nr:hypothetical protein [Candidatus Eremiobacteraeota bacterium]